MNPFSIVNCSIGENSSKYDEEDEDDERGDEEDEEEEEPDDEPKKDITAPHQLPAATYEVPTAPYRTPAATYGLPAAPSLQTCTNSRNTSIPPEVLIFQS